MKSKIYFLVFITSFLLVTGAAAQDTSTLQFEEGDSWEFEVTKGTYEYTEGGAIEAEETYTFEIDSSVSDSGDYNAIIDGPDGQALGEFNAGDFGADAIYADWEYWESNAASDLAADFNGVSESDVTIDNGDEIFNATINNSGITVEFAYFKSTGVFAEFSILGTGGSDLAGENITGAEADSGFLPGFNVYVTILGVLALVPIVRKFR